jgi:hypothetical protein
MRNLCELGRNGIVSGDGAAFVAELVGNVLICQSLHDIGEAKNLSSALDQGLAGSDCSKAYPVCDDDIWHSTVRTYRTDTCEEIDKTNATDSDLMYHLRNWQKL